MTDIMQSSIFVEGLSVEASVGVFDWEKQVRQLLIFDLECEYAFDAAMRSDDIADAMSYVAVTEHVQGIVGEGHYELLEHLAGKLVSRLFAAFPDLQTVNLKIAKPGAVPEANSVGVRMHVARSASS